MGIENIWLDPSAILLPGRDHGGGGGQAGSSLQVLRAGPLQLARQNHCSCSLAESDIFHMSKENKICHCARQSEIFLKHKVLLQWFVFISSLEDHCS